MGMGTLAVSGSCFNISLLYLGVIVLSVSAVDVPVSAENISVMGEDGASLFRGVRGLLLKAKLV